MAELTRPPRLSAGERVVVVSLAGPSKQDQLDAGCERLRGWGLDVVVAPHALDVHDPLEYLAGSDADRAADLQAAWLDPAVSGVFCARGGYGVQRMVDLLDWDAMREADPKVFAGYSDVTALHEAFALRLGVATLHAPMVAVKPFTSDERSVNLLRRTLFEPESVLSLTSTTAETMVPGRACGITVGGCVSLLTSDIGTPTGRRGFAGGILVLEDTLEDVERLDRIFTQFLRAGLADGVAGIALGSWQDCKPPERVRDLALDRFRGLGVPIVWELGFGHGPSSLTIPLGIPATLDADAAVLTLDVPALI
ncbi:MAG: S66 peptidase family protein [Jiangellaceae bacterium]